MPLQGCSLFRAGIKTGGGEGVRRGSHYGGTSQRLGPYRGLISHNCENVTKRKKTDDFFTQKNVGWIQKRVFLLFKIKYVCSHLQTV